MNISKIPILLSFIIIPAWCHATIFYLDPNNGNINNDGTSLQPWRTLQEVFDNNLIETRSYSPLPYTSASTLQIKNSGAPVKGGDTLLLRNGYHGEIFYRGIYNDDYITIMKDAGHQPVVGKIQISAGSKFIFDGLLITPEEAPTFFYAQLFFLESHGYHGPSREVIIRNCTLMGISNASGWGLTEWNDVGSCIKIAGNQSIVENCTCVNIDEGISITADSCLVRNNRIINFAGDGMRGQGSYLTFEYNTVKNCYDVNGNHDDGFQAFTNPSNPFVNNILRGNTIINYEDPNQPFRGALQGIGCFDGPYQGWLIENNLIVVNHFHGISLYGAENCKIINNTVVDIDSVNSPNGTWIRITDHKNGTPSSGCIIQNNLSFGFSYGSETTFNNNLLITGYQDFVDPANGNFNLAQGSAAIDEGENDMAPQIDIVGTIRPLNAIVDIGAYEYQGLHPCTHDVWLLNYNLTMSSTEHIHQNLTTSGSVSIMPFTTHQFTVGSFAEFLPGFSVEENATLEIILGPCQNL